VLSHLYVAASEYDVSSENEGYAVTGSSRSQHLHRHCSSSTSTDCALHRQRTEHGAFDHESVAGHNCPMRQDHTNAYDNVAAPSRVVGMKAL
jgi:uncharacterized protein with LGFP repeats